MKKLFKLILATACIGTVSFSASARYPVTCDDWLQLLNNCEAGAPISYYGMTCAQIYYNWQDCKMQDDPWRLAAIKEEH